MIPFAVTVLALITASIVVGVWIAVSVLDDIRQDVHHLAVAADRDRLPGLTKPTITTIQVRGSAMSEN